MSGTGNFLKLIASGVLLATLPASAQAPARRPVKALRPASQKPVQLPPMPSGPLPPVPLNQIPPAPPQVSYKNGLLTIVAENSTLVEILRQVHEKTGATIDVPATATERVIAHLGPGPARDVLATLLNGSSFNYVLLGSASDPTSLARIQLSGKPAGGAGSGSGPVTTAYQPPQEYTPPMTQMPPGAGPGGQVAEEATPDEEAADEEAEEEPEEADQDQAQNGEAAAQDQAQPNAGPKTPEQILEMLRKRSPGQPIQPGQPVNPPMQMPPDQNNDNNE